MLTKDQQGDQLLELIRVDEVQQTLAFAPDEEISKVRWWDGSEATGTISGIDQELIEPV